MSQRAAWGSLLIRAKHLFKQKSCSNPSHGTTSSKLIYDYTTLNRAVHFLITLPLRATIGGAWAPEPPCTSRSQPWSVQILLFNDFFLDCSDLSEGMEAKRQERNNTKRLFGTQPKKYLARAGWATPWADFTVITDQLWSTITAIFPCVALSWRFDSSSRYSWFTVNPKRGLRFEFETKTVMITFLGGSVDEIGSEGLSFPATVLSSPVQSPVCWSHLCWCAFVCNFLPLPLLSCLVSGSSLFSRIGSHSIIESDSNQMWFSEIWPGCDWHLVGSLRLVDTRVELVNFTALSLQLAPTGSNSSKLAPTRSNSPKLVHSFLLLFLFFSPLFLRWLNSIFVWFEDRVEPAQLNLHTDFNMTFPNSKVIGSCGRAGSSEGMAANQDCTIFWYKKSMLRFEMAKFSYNFTQLWVIRLENLKWSNSDLKIQVGSNLFGRFAIWNKSELKIWSKLIGKSESAKKETSRAASRTSTLHSWK